MGEMRYDLLLGWKTFSLSKTSFLNGFSESETKQTYTQFSFLLQQYKVDFVTKWEMYSWKKKHIKGLKYRIHWKKRTVYGWLKKSIAFMANTAPLSSQGVIWFWGPIRLMSSPFVFNIGSLWGSSWHIKFPLLYQMRYRLHVEV